MVSVTHLEFHSVSLVGGSRPYPGVMAEESRGLAAEKRSWKPTKLPATTVNSLVSITHLNTTGEETGREGWGQDTERVIHLDRFNR